MIEFDNPEQIGAVRLLKLSFPEPDDPMISSIERRGDTIIGFNAEHEPVQGYTIDHNNTWGMSDEEVIECAESGLDYTGPLGGERTADTTPPTFTKPLAPLPEWLKGVEELVGGK